MAKHRKRGRSLKGFMRGIEKDIDDCIGSKPECVVSVLDAASDSARETAQHLRSNWQDRDMAKAWERIAGHIDTAKARVMKELPF